MEIDDAVAGQLVDVCYYQYNTIHRNLSRNRATASTMSHWTRHIINHPHPTRGRRVALDPHPPTQCEPATSPVTPLLPLPSSRDVGIQPRHLQRHE